MIIFNDESNFKIINRKYERFVHHKNTEKYLKQHMQSCIQKGDGSVGIWGCISGSGVGCHKIYERRLNQYGYRDILESSLIPSRDIFQADQNWLFQQDLNPIKNLWGWMDYQLTKKQITSHEMLKKELTKLWLEIPIKMIENFIESMRRRLQVCIKSNGGHIPY